MSAGRRDGQCCSDMDKEERGWGCELRAIYTINGITDPPRRERRKLPRMKMDLEAVGWESG